MDDKYLAPALKVFVDGTALAPDVALHISRATVTLQRDSLDQFTLDLVNPYPELPWTHGALKDTFAEGMPVQVQMGYVDGLQPLFDGEVTRIGAVFAREGASTLRVAGHTWLHRLQAATRTRAFVQTTDSDIVSKIAGEAGLTPKVTGGTDLTFEYVAQVNQTDLDFLRARARRAGYEVFGVGKELHFVPLRSAGTKAYTLVWGRTAKAFTEPGEYPLQSFAPTVDAQGLVTGVTVRWYDVATLEKVEGMATATTSTMGGASTGPQTASTAFGEAPLLVVDRPVATPAEAKALATALLDRRALRFVTATGSAVGLPELTAGTVVEIDGVGDRFSGEYLVQRATHDFGPDGYVTTFDAVRNAAG